LPHIPGTTQSTRQISLGEKQLPVTITETRPNADQNPSAEIHVRTMVKKSRIPEENVEAITKEMKRQEKLRQKHTKETHPWTRGPEVETTGRRRTSAKLEQTPEELSDWTNPWGEKEEVTQYPYRNARLEVLAETMQQMEPYIETALPQIQQLKEEAKLQAEAIIEKAKKDAEKGFKEGLKAGLTQPAHLEKQPGEMLPFVSIEELPNIEGQEAPAEKLARKGAVLVHKGTELLEPIGETIRDRIPKPQQETKQQVIKRQEKRAAIKEISAEQRKKAAQTAQGWAQAAKEYAQSFYDEVKNELENGQQNIESAPSDIAEENE
jgi:hypothetical protein